MVDSILNRLYTICIPPSLIDGENTGEPGAT